MSFSQSDTILVITIYVCIEDVSHLQARGQLSHSKIEAGSRLEARSESTCCASRVLESKNWSHEQGNVRAKATTQGQEEKNSFTSAMDKVYMGCNGRIQV